MHLCDLRRIEESQRKEKRPWMHRESTHWSTRDYVTISRDSDQADLSLEIEASTACSSRALLRI